MTTPTGRPPRRSGSTCAGRWPAGWRSMTRGSIRPRWCTGGGGARSERPHRVNEAIRLIVEQTGVMKARRAVDSTILADAVATQDTITQLVSAIRRVAREVPGAAEQIAAVCTGHDYAVPGKPKIDWDDPAAKDALVSALVSDANAVVAAFGDAKLDEAPPRPRWRCWPWSPGRTWSPPRALTGRRAVADRPQGRRGRVITHRRPRCPAHPQVAGGPPRRYRAHLAADPETGSSPMRS